MIARRMKAVLLLLIIGLLSGCSVIRQVEVRADVSQQITGNFHYTEQGHDYGGGKLARIEIEAPLYEHNGIRIFSGVTHESLLDTRHDRGQERVHVGVSWRPFR